MKNKLGLATLALSTAMTLFIPAVASAHDSDDYRRGTEMYQRGNSRGWEHARDRYNERAVRERERELERQRELARERQRQQYRGGYYNNRNYNNRNYNGYSNNGYYDRYGYWHQY